MRERLIELLKKANYIVKRNGFEFNANVMADYLLSEGVIVPPCKIGDVVYVTDIINGKICECEVISITGFAGEENTLIEYKTPKEVFDIFSYECPDTEIGKTVFLTKEEAEQALAERECKV